MCLQSNCSSKFVLYGAHYVSDVRTTAITSHSRQATTATTKNEHPKVDVVVVFFFFCSLVLVIFWAVWFGEWELQVIFFLCCCCCYGFFFIFGICSSCDSAGGYKMIFRIYFVYCDWSSLARVSTQQSLCNSLRVMLVYNIPYREVPFEK